MRFDAPTSHANVVIRLKGPPQSSHNPVNGLLSGQPSNYVHIWTVPTTKKEESPYLQAWPVPGILVLQLSTAELARAISKKVVGAADSYKPRQVNEKVIPRDSGKLFQHRTTATSETMKEGRLFHFT